MKASLDELRPSPNRTAHKTHLPYWRVRCGFAAYVIGALRVCYRFTGSPLALLLMSAVSLRAAVQWQQDFEGSAPGWTVEGITNIWQIGVSTSGPGRAHTGSRVAGTILNNNCPGNFVPTLVSPRFVVPAAGQQPRLRFWSGHDTASAGCDLSAGGGIAHSRLRGTSTGDSNSPAPV